MDVELERIPMVGDVVRIRIISTGDVISGVITKMSPMGICIEPGLAGDGYVFVRFGDIQLLGL